MAQDATLHVKLDRQTDAQLKQLAQTRGTSKGQLVRDAIATCYQVAMDDLPVEQSHAIAAYQGGFISLSRLAKAMGMHALELRPWLAERGLEQRSVYGADDVDCA